MAFLMSTSPYKILTLPSKFKSLGALSRRFKGSTRQQVSKDEKDNFRCKDYLKLRQIDRAYNLVRPGFKVLDIGAAPGSWSQYLAERTNSIRGDGLVVAMDVTNFESIKGVQALPEMDFTKESSQKKILEILGRVQKFDCIFSDMVPVPTGVKNIDEKRMTKLIFYVYLFLLKHLKEGGSCVIKIQGSEYINEVKSKAKKIFGSVMFPETRISSGSPPEIYLLGQHFKLVKA